MGTIIDNEALQHHKIEKYRFETLDLELEEEEPFDPALFTTEIDELPASPTTAAEQITDKEPLAEEIAQLNAEISTLHKRLDKERTQHTQELEKVREEAFEAGRSEGIKETQHTLQEQLDETRMQMLKSISDLQELMQRYATLFDTLQEEVAQSALLIARHVIAAEVETKSAQIAEQIARLMVDNLKEATHITLHLNPKDAASLRDSLQDLSHLTIKEDASITPGGAILYSDAGNIDATLEARIKRTIALLNKES